ncbi:hypothetical protein Q7689_00025 [Nocardiopsis tropica]|uniref:hypothetical protein n=1 Tax=Nocardiopsis tropica TaxID=109330 RepID=UPI002E8A6D30|nr:hypothetical protein [Nocardiopsis tropica]
MTSDADQVVEMSMRAIALIRAVHHADEDGVQEAFADLDATGVAMVAVQAARITGNLIAANSPHSVDEVCKKLRRQLTPHRRMVLRKPRRPPLPDLPPWRP